MRVNITGRHIDINDYIKQHIQKKLAKLEKYFENIQEVHVILTAQKHRESAEIICTASKKAVSSFAESNDIFASIDSAIEKLERQLRKIKEKIKEKRAKTS